jgi:cytidylate kinase
VSECVADRTGFLYLNSGRFYRAITWKTLDRSISTGDEAPVVEIARSISIAIDGDRFLVDGVDRVNALHDATIDRATAIVSRIPAVRSEVNRRLIEIAGDRDVVVEGRDMSTVVFPDAQVKIFLDADANARARRRKREHNDPRPLQEVERAIRERDEIDATKPVGRLERPDDAVYVETTHLTLDQVCEKVVAIIQQKIEQKPGALS